MRRGVQRVREGVLMSLYTDHITLTRILERSPDEATPEELAEMAELAGTVWTNAISVIVKITELFDDNVDSDGCWDSGNVCDRVSTLLLRAGFFLDCPSHGVYARNKPQCPTCEMEESQ